MSYRLTPWEDDVTWDRFVADSPEGAIFSRSAFFQAVASPVQRWRVVKGTETVAAVPVVLDETGAPRLGPHPYTLYQGPMFAARVHAQPIHSRYPEQGRITAFLLEALSQQYPRLSFCLHHQWQDIREFVWFRYHGAVEERCAVQVRHTGLVELATYADFEAYVAAVRPVRRREYRQALAEGAQLREGTLDDLPRFMALYRKTFTRQEIDLSARELQWVERIVTMALRDRCGELLFCELPDGRTTCGTLFLADERCAYYLLSGTDTEFRRFPANTILMFENVRRAMARGLRWVDCIGLNSPQRGDFKVGFNAVPVPYYLVTWPPLVSGP